LAMSSQIKNKRLTKEDWIEFGLETAGELGMEALRIDDLCIRQNVTRGSFYWHFEGREDFLNCILEHWRECETVGIIYQVEENGGNSYQQLAYLFTLANSGEINFNAELAIRVWARSQKEAAELVKQVDEDRIIYMAGKLRQSGASEADARIRAFFLYSLIFGEAMIRGQESKAERNARQLESFKNVFNGLDIAHLK